MVNIYSSEDFEIVKKQKRKIFVIFWCSFAVLLAINIAVLVFYALQEYNTPLKTPLILINILSCSIFAIIFYPIMAIKYRRTKMYYKMLYYFEHGIRREGTNVFVRVDSSVTEKDGVDFINLVFLQWSDKKQEYFERNILLDIEKPIPDFSKGDMIHHITQGNILIAYELKSEQIFE